MKSMINWKHGKPEHSGQHLVMMGTGEVTVKNYYNSYTSPSCAYWEDVDEGEEIIAWCDMENICVVVEQTDDTYKQALQAFGCHHQRMMCIEECAELIDALAKYDRGRADTKDVITELADVCIMVEQMAMLFGKGEFEKEKERKLKRLQKKIDEASNL